MENAVHGTTWKEIAETITEEFLSWGCRYDRKKLAEIAMSYDCTPLYFWNWMDDPEISRTERGFLRVLGYAWRRHMQTEAPAAPDRRVPDPAAAEKEMAA